MALALPLAIAVVVARQKVGCMMTQSLYDASLSIFLFLRGAFIEEEGGLRLATYDVCVVRAITSLDRNLKHYISITINITTKIKHQNA